MIGRLRRLAMAGVGAGALACGTLAFGAPSALADYGGGAQYQIEVSDNCNGLQDCAPVQGGGVWLWIELDAGGGGDYQGADCAHGVPDATGTFSAAAKDGGDVTWTSDGTTLTIRGVALLDGAYAVTITVPAAYGHYALPGPAVISGVGSGQAQVQVAP